MIAESATQRDLKSIIKKKKEQFLTRYWCYHLLITRLSSDVI